MVSGGAEDTKSLLKNRFDHIFYTGRLLPGGRKVRSGECISREVDGEVKVLRLVYAARFFDPTTFSINFKLVRGTKCCKVRK